MTPGPENGDQRARAPTEHAAPRRGLPIARTVR